jgi:maltodextrin utilization protein YvdJ
MVDFIINDKYYDGLNTCNIISDLLFDAYYEDSNVGYNKKIFINNIKSNNLNYYINNKICYGNILPQFLDISFNGLNKEYDGTNKANITYNNTLVKLTYNAFFENYNVGIQILILIIIIILLIKNILYMQKLQKLLLW